MSYLLSLAAGGSGAGAGGSTSYIVLMVVLIGVMYFVMIRPQKKRQKEEQEMRASLEIGDEIITIGGIVGRVVTIREEDIVIETGADSIKRKLKLQDRLQRIRKTAKSLRKKTLLQLKKNQRF